MIHNPIILDGGMGTELEFQGHNVQHPLWSAKLLYENPVAIRDVHVAYHDAGAHVATTNTYQASIPGFVTHCQLQPSTAAEMLWRAVELARDAQEIVRKNRIDESSRRPELMVGRSCGPFGAYLHDGSEYTGHYRDGTTNEDIDAFHKSRLDVLARDMEANEFVCFETLPSKREAERVYGLLKLYPQLVAKVWISFCCKPQSLLRCGYGFANIVDDLLTMDAPNGFLAGLGVNCTEPETTVSCFESLKAIPNFSQRLGKKILVAYPNAGEAWDVVEKRYVNPTQSLVPSVPFLLDQGVGAIGGCCRVRPEQIRLIAAQADNWRRDSIKRGALRVVDSDTQSIGAPMLDSRSTI